jgi:hypothetical protein
MAKSKATSYKFVRTSAKAFERKQKQVGDRALLLFPSFFFLRECERVAQTPAIVLDDVITLIMERKMEQKNGGRGGGRNLNLQ